MGIKPIITLAIAVEFWIIFEISANYVIRRWRLTVEKEMWALAYWCVLIGCLVICGLIPFMGRGGGEWCTFFGIGALHVYLCFNHYFCSSYDPLAAPSPDTDNTPGSTPSSTPRQHGTNTSGTPKPTSKPQIYRKD